MQIIRPLTADEKKEIIQYRRQRLQKSQGMERKILRKLWCNADGSLIIPQWYGWGSRRERFPY